MKRLSSPHLLVGILATSAFLLLSTADAFTFPSSYVGGSKSTILTARSAQHPHGIGSNRRSSLFIAGDENDGGGSSGVVELADDDEEDGAAAPASPAAPFLSQGEISEEVLNPDLSDPKQTRVILYIIISLVPVLFLVPLMLGSRDLIPLESLPPVDI